MTDNFAMIAAISLQLRGSEQARAALLGLSEEVSALKTNFPALGKFAQNSFAKISDSIKIPLDKLSGYADKIKAQFSDVGKRIEESSAKARDSIGQLAEKYDEAALHATMLGRVSGTLGQVGGIASQFGAFGVAEGIGIGTTILDTIDSLPKFSAAIQGAAVSLQGLGGVLGGLAQVGAGAVTGMGALGSAIGAIGAVALPLVAAGGALYLIVKYFQDLNEAAEKARQVEIENLLQQTGSQLNVRTLARDFSKQELEEKRKALDEELELRKETLNPLRNELQTLKTLYDRAGESSPRGREAEKQLYDMGYRSFSGVKERIDVLEAVTKPLTEEFKELFNQWTDITKASRLASNDPAIQNAAVQGALERIAYEKNLQHELATLAKEGSSEILKARIQSQKEEMDTVQAQLSELQKIKNPTEDTKTQITALTQRMKDLSGQTFILENFTLKLVEAREAENKTLEQLKESYDKTLDAAKEAAQITGDLKDLDADRNKTLAQRRRDSFRSLQESILERQIEAAKKQEGLAESEKRIADLRARATDENKAAEKTLKEETAKINQDYFDSELKALADFRQNEQRINDDFALAQKRKLEDLNDDLLALAAGRDVAGFISRQREGAKDLTRSAEDFGIDAGRRAIDFAQQRGEAAAQRAQQLADLREGYQKERAIRIAEQQKAIQDELDSRVVRETESQKLEQKLAALRQRFADEDNALRLAEEDKAYRDRRAALQKSLGEQTVLMITGFGTQLGLMGQFVTGGITYLQKLVNAVPTVPTTKLPTSITQNADGGIYSSPTYSLLGEKRGWADVVIPVRQSEGIVKAMRRLAGGGNGQITVNYQPSVIVGDIASKGDVTAALQGYERDLIASLQTAIEGAA